MNITHYGHACVLLEVPASGRPVRILLDPGSYSPGFEDLRDLDLILITHTHPDHLDVDRIRALNTHAELIHSPGASTALAGYPGPTRVAKPGDTLEIHGVGITVAGGQHACIHPDLPRMDNNGYLIADSVYHPGDAFDQPPAAADTLLLPVGGPWMKISEGIDYLRSVAPRVAIPIHQSGLAPVHQELHYNLLRNLGPANSEIVILDHASTHTL
ncbi:MBL fold metallo-hydrolase [Sciscionella marina]|uniref:MBL fold metallo-hydrolase n=1 Tax=Sciscionella marina TaxID=508770 RepID=UPI000368094A|nr:MBL fold metallo-hydrolase [Sciscionella marina]